MRRRMSLDMWVRSNGERIFHVEGKRPRSGRRLDQHLQAVRKKLWVPVTFAEFAIVVDRMVVAGGGLER